MLIGVISYCKCESRRFLNTKIGQSANESEKFKKTLWKFFWAERRYQNDVSFLTDAHLTWKILY